MDKSILELGVAGLLAYQIGQIVHALIKGAFEMVKHKRDDGGGNGSTVIPCYQLMQRLVESEIRQTAILEELSHTTQRIEQKIDSRPWAS